MRSGNRLRVLHVLGALDRGGIEKWLLEVLRNTPSGSWSTEFLLHSTEPGAYDDEVRALGGVLRYCPGPGKPLAYARRLRTVLRNHGPYDVVHSHVHFYSGIVLRVAHAAGVPVRIAHSHTTMTEPGTARTLYALLMRRLIRSHATHGVGISRQAAAALFGKTWEQQPRVRILEYGFDFSDFATLPDRDTLRRQLGLPAGRAIIGSVARFVAVKNHAFLVSTFAELVRSGLDAHLLLVGAGPLEADVRQQVDALGLSERCTFAGGHNDVTRFFGALDLLLLPSLFEGFAIVTLEAQAAGVPVLASTAVPSEVQVIPGLIHRLPLDEGTVAWAHAAQRVMTTAPKIDRALAAHALDQSRFGISRAVRELDLLYHVTSDTVVHQNPRAAIQGRDLPRAQPS